MQNSRIVLAPPERRELRRRSGRRSGRADDAKRARLILGLAGGQTYFTSVPDLSRKLLRYIAQYNKAPKAFKWSWRNPSQRIHPTYASLLIQCISPCSNSTSGFGREMVCVPPRKTCSSASSTSTLIRSIGWRESTARSRVVVFTVIGRD